MDTGLCWTMDVMYDVHVLELISARFKILKSWTSIQCTCNRFSKRTNKDSRHLDNKSTKFLFVFFSLNTRRVPFNLQLACFSFQFLCRSFLDERFRQDFIAIFFCRIPQTWRCFIYLVPTHY